jgi:hypothetical protein
VGWKTSYGKRKIKNKRKNRRIFEKERIDGYLR